LDFSETQSLAQQLCGLLDQNNSILSSGVASAIALATAAATSTANPSLASTGAAPTPSVFTGNAPADAKTKEISVSFVGIWTIIGFLLCVP